MVKIPTFESRTRITAEPAGVTTGIRVSPTATPAAALSKVAKVAEDYYIKQRDNTEKLEAKEKFFEMKSESDKIIESQKNNADEFQSVEIYNEKFGSYRKQQLSLIKNKRVKKRSETLLDIDQAENVYNIKKNSFKAMEAKSNEIYNQEQNSLGVKRTLETDPNKKKQIQDQQIESAREYENIHGMGDAWLNKETKKIIADNELFDVEQALTRKDYGTALNLLKKSTAIDKEDVQKKLLDINKQYTTALADQNIDSIILNEQGPAVVGANIKNIDGKEITEKDLEKGANRFALEKNPDGQLKYSTAQVIEKTVKNNIKVPFYLSALDAGGNITDTSNPEATRAGLELYRTFKNQNALQSLTSIYKLGKDDLATYQRLDFSMNVMKQTFDQAYKNELMFKNNPDKYKLLKADGKKVTDTVNELDFPGVKLFRLGLEFENEAYAAQIIKNVANNVMIATGSEKTALEFAKGYVQENYKVDDFGQLVPINNAYPEYHDAAIKLYIKDLYESGRINKEQHKEEDIIPVYFNPGSLTSNQGFVLRDKTTGVPITIDVVTAQGDFDEANYDDARFTYKEIVEKIYPLMKDKRYDDFVNNYNRIKLQKQTFDSISTETP